MTEYSIKDLFNVHFGASGGLMPVFQLPEGKKSDSGAMYNRLITGGKYKDLYGRAMFMPLKLGDWWLPVEPLVSISLSKTIVSTPIVGAPFGSVKELVGSEDTIINVQGMLINKDSDDYPTEQLNELRKLYFKDETLDIVCQMVNEMHVTEVIIENLNLLEIKMQHIQAFEMTLKEDKNIEAYIEGVASW